MITCARWSNNDGLLRLARTERVIKSEHGSLTPPFSVPMAQLSPNPWPRHNDRQMKFNMLIIMALEFTKCRHGLLHRPHFYCLICFAVCFFLLFRVQFDAGSRAVALCSA